MNSEPDDEAANSGEEIRRLRREIARLEAENIDLKNRLADLKHEADMNSWLR